MERLDRGDQLGGRCDRAAEPLEAWVSGLRTIQQKRANEALPNSGEALAFVGPFRDHCSVVNLQRREPAPSPTAMRARPHGRMLEAGALPPITSNYTMRQGRIAAKNESSLPAREPARELRPTARAGCSLPKLWRGAAAPTSGLRNLATALRL